MNTDLKTHWFTMCLLPHVVNKDTPEVRGKFVACLLGDEQANDAEFCEMLRNVSTYTVGPCRWRYEGACFHPFRPGSMVSAIFASCFNRDDPGITPILEDKTFDYLDHRKCVGCGMQVSKWTLLESAFHGYGRMYDDMMENAVGSRTLYGIDWVKFRKRYSGMIDDVRLFEGGCLAVYEPNVRRHLEELAEKHYKLLEVALSAPYDNVDEAVDKAVNAIRFELVMHFSHYWEKELYKKEAV